MSYSERSTFNPLIMGGQACIRNPDDPKRAFYGDFRRLVEVRYDHQDRVARIRGGYLEQAGRPLFNERTRRSDVERTFPKARWYRRALKDCCQLDESC